MNPLNTGSEAVEDGGAGDKNPVPKRRYSRRVGDSGATYKSSNIWIISFTDIMALMLTFFVLLYSMSAPEVESWQEMTAALRKELNKHMGPAHNRGPVDSIDIGKIDYNRALDLSYLEAIINQLMQEEELLEGIRAEQSGSTLLISLPQDLVFEPGSAEVSEKGSDTLFALTTKLSRIRNSIEIIGHADPRAVNDSDDRFSSNWDLSLSRALNVAAALKKVGYDDSVAVRGLSSALYKDLPEDMSEEERLRMSRRVDIVIMEHDSSVHRTGGITIQ